MRFYLALIGAAMVAVAVMGQSKSGPRVMPKRQPAPPAVIDQKGPDAGPREGRSNPALDAMRRY